MKKYFIGVILGLFLSFGVSAHAEVSNLIDQVVQGMFPVTIDGQSMGDAIVVDNKTYLPVREFGEAVGYAVTFTDNREVVLTKNEIVTNPIPSEQPTAPSADPQATDSKVKPLTMKNIVLNIKDKLEKNMNEENYFEKDGNQYVAATVLSNPYTITFNNPTLIFNKEGQEIISVEIKNDYFVGVESFTLNGSAYVKLSVLGLKATVSGDTLIIDKQ